MTFGQLVMLSLAQRAPGQGRRMENTSQFVAVQLEVRIEDWISSLGEEIQNRLGIAGGMHTASSCFNAAAAAAAAAADLYVRCAAGQAIALSCMKCLVCD